jgi:hypothetical protein
MLKADIQATLRQHPEAVYRTRYNGLVQLTGAWTAPRKDSPARAHWRKVTISFDGAGEHELNAIATVSVGDSTNEWAALTPRELIEVVGNTVEEAVQVQARQRDARIQHQEAFRAGEQAAKQAASTLHTAARASGLDWNVEDTYGGQVKVTLSPAATEALADWLGKQS